MTTHAKIAVTLPRELQEQARRASIVAWTSFPCSPLSSRQGP
ncbi:MAG: hypothetical protein ABIW46_04385 [Acidimicrobiales bacterium]